MADPKPGAADASAEIETKRLSLRPLTPADAPALFEALQASREPLRRRLSWVDDVHGVADEEMFILAADEARERGTAQVCGVFERASGGLLGVASLSPIETAHASKAELEAWIRVDSQDKGFGAEAARALCEHAFHKLQLHRLYARIDPANRPSRKVLKRLHFRYEGTLREDKKLNGRWVQQECWGLLRSEWQKQHK